MKYHYVFSVGGAGIGYMAGAYTALRKLGYPKPDYVYGNSSGAIMSAFISAGYSITEIENFVMSMKKKDVAKLRPFALLSGHSLYSMKPLQDWLYDKLIGRPFTIPAFVQCVNLYDGQLETYNLAEVSHIADQIVYRSCSIPGIMPLDGCRVDGGVRNPIPLSLAIDNANAGDMIIVISRHPIEGHVTMWKSDKKKILAQGSRTLEIMQAELTRMSINFFLDINEMIVNSGKEELSGDNFTYHYFNSLIVAPSMPLNIGTMEFDRIKDFYKRGELDARNAHAEFEEEKEKPET